MALISDLVSAIAEVENLPEETVNLVARYTREAGYLSQGARGRNAPRATVTDAANLLIAVNASGCIVKDAPRAVELYRDLVCHAPHGRRTVRGVGVEYSKIDQDELQFLDRHGDATFGEMLESMIERFIGGELPIFMMREAQNYLTEEFYHKIVAEVGEADKVALANKIAEACGLLVSTGTVAIKVEFGRPLPHARIVIDRANGPERELIAASSFIVHADDLMTGKVKQFEGDRRERTSFGYRTLMKIADVMR